MKSRARIRLAGRLVSTALVVLAAPRAAGSAAEMLDIAGRARATLVAEAPDSAAIAALQADLRPDGTWADVDYADTSITGWSPATHVRRLRDLSAAWAATESDPALLADALAAFDAWISRDPTGSNWWHNQIYTPQRLGEALLLLEPELDAPRLAGGLAIVARAYIPRSTNSGTNTGANRIDRAYPGILRGLLAGDEALLAESYAAMGDTILVTTSEGVQPDFSYHQHGAQLHIRGYGPVYLAGLLRYGGWAGGTGYNFEPIQQRVLVDFLLEGVQWFIRGDSVDDTAAGRGLTRPGQADVAATFLRPLHDAPEVAAGYRTTELQAFANRLENDVATGTADPTTALIGHRHFWRSDSTTFHRPRFSVFLKTSSTRTRQPESGNGEGLKNLHLADGVTLLQRHGNEYDDIMPLWDWRTLPGTTTAQGSYSLKPSSDWGVPGTSTHAGGVSDSEAGATAFAYSRLGVSGKKSWFFLGDRMIALGTAIEAPSASDPVLTTVNQCLLEGPVTYSSGGSTHQLDSPRESVGSLEWVHHDGLGYYFPGSTPAATLVAETRTGSWSSINNAQSADPVTGSVFALHLDHGHPVTGGDYAYIVAPVDDAASMEAESPDELIIERNDAIAQAVIDPTDGRTAVNFWSASTVAGITADHACSVLVRRDEEHLEVALSDPSQSLTGDLLLELDSAVAGVLHLDGGITVESQSPQLRLRVAMAGNQGRTCKARFFVREHAYQQLTLPAVADGYVFDRHPDTAYGTEETAVAKLITSPDWNRLAYFRFDLSSLPAAPSAATLELHALGAQNPGLHAIQHLPESAAWTESSLTWNARPEPAGPPLGLWLPIAGGRFTTDLSSAAADSAHTLDLVVIPHTRTNDGLTTYATREHPDPALRPALKISIARPEIEIWRLQHFGDAADVPAIAGDHADPDRDGLANAIEFVLGTSPQFDSSRHRPFGRIVGTHYIYSFRRSHISAQEDVFVESSTDLTSWTRLEPGVAGTTFTRSSPEPAESGIDWIEVSVPLLSLPPGLRHFIRLGIQR